MKTFAITTALIAATAVPAVSSELCSNSALLAESIMEVRQMGVPQDSAIAVVFASADSFPAQNLGLALVNAAYVLPMEMGAAKKAAAVARFGEFAEGICLEATR